VGVQEPPPHPTPPRATSKVDVDKAMLEGETSKEEKEVWKERRRRRGRRRTRGGVTRVATIRADGAPAAGPHEEGRFVKDACGGSGPHGKTWGYKPPAGLHRRTELGRRKF
jgi:hypothetical protein